MVAKIRNSIRYQTHNLPLTFWYLWGGTVVTRMGTFVIPFLTLYLTSKRDLLVGEATLVVGVYGLGSFLSGFLGGGLADNIGRRQTILLSLFLSPLMLLLLSQMRSFFALGLITFAFGFFTELYRPASSAMVADVVAPEDRQRAFNLMYWGINIGAGLAPLLAGFFATRSYLLLFILDALTTFLFGLIVFVRVPDSRPENLKNATTRQGYQRADLQVLFTDYWLWAFIACNFVIGCAYMQGFATLPLDMKAKGLSEQDYGVAMAVNGFLVVLVALPINTYLVRYSRFGVLASAALLLGLGFGMNALISTPLWYVVAVIIWTMGEIIAAPVNPTVMDDLAPLNLRGLYQGLTNATWGLSAFVGPVVGGLIFSEWGGSTLWQACFVVGIVVMICYLMLAQPIHKHLQHRQTLRATPIQ